ncbi:MAG: serine acetyltransferase [Aliivibrio sp.]|uniref:serine O-acetyltransferase n=1 Tax=Aliivibrio sp. TaxID=1872443 RepID=UPI001A5B4951|nr:serine acetyltransferase [Aliivibrio sp.]
MPNAIFFHRISRWFYLREIPLIPKICQLIIFLIYSTKLPPNVSIGKNTSFSSLGISVVIIDNAVLGENCSIGFDAKIVGKSPYKEVPIIGNNVYIGPGSVICGAVIIEDNVIIAPNAVVTKSVPEGSIVGGIPAKIIGHVSDLDYDIFNNESYIEGYVEFMSKKS